MATVCNEVLGDNAYQYEVSTECFRELGYLSIAMGWIAENGDTSV
jgi:hypothetical protein